MAKPSCQSISRAVMADEDNEFERPRKIPKTLKEKDSGKRLIVILEKASLETVKVLQSVVYLQSLFKRETRDIGKKARLIQKNLRKCRTKTLWAKPKTHWSKTKNLIFLGKLHYHCHMHRCGMSFSLKKQQSSSESIINVKVSDCYALCGSVKVLLRCVHHRIRN